MSTNDEAHTTLTEQHIRRELIGIARRINARLGQKATEEEKEQIQQLREQLRNIRRGGWA